MAEKKDSIFGSLINAKNAERDIKLLAFGITIAAAIVWLSYDLWRSKLMTSIWVDAFMWLLAAVSIGGAGWAAVEGWRSRTKTPPTPPPTTPTEGGQL